MANYSYSPEKGDAVSRVRRDLGDRDLTAPRWTDEEILSFLRETATTDFLSLELASDTTVTLESVAHALVGGTLEVRVGTTAVELLLRRIIHGGTPQAGGASSITLAAGASATPSAYVGKLVRITAGTGAGQEATVSAYDAVTKVATTSTAWATAPDVTSDYQVLEADAFALSTGIDYDKITDLVDAVRALGKGWSILLATKAEGSVIDCPWPPPSVAARREVAAYGRLTADLMLTGGELNVFGTPKRLSLYNLEGAITRMRYLEATDASEPHSVTDGDVTITRTSVDEILKATAAPMGFGAYRTIS